MALPLSIFWQYNSGRAHLVPGFTTAWVRLRFFVQAADEALFSSVLVPKNEDYLGLLLPLIKVAEQHSHFADPKSYDKVKTVTMLELFVAASPSFRTIPSKCMYDWHYPLWPTILIVLFSSLNPSKDLIQGKCASFIYILNHFPLYSRCRTLKRHTTFLHRR